MVNDVLVSLKLAGVISPEVVLTAVQVKPFEMAGIQRTSPRPAISLL
jgi:hypothetical protein